MRETPAETSVNGETLPSAAASESGPVATERGRTSRFPPPRPLAREAWPQRSPIVGLALQVGPREVHAPSLHESNSLPLALRGTRAGQTGACVMAQAHRKCPAELALHTPSSTERERPQAWASATQVRRPLSAWLDAKALAGANMVSAFSDGGGRLEERHDVIRQG